ncbi:hypothetical protein, unlikely [Trypanosoma brucei gambiense DAL972]|uniref:Uncharacterized protein n=1 Tax=Trypanosoma brucei gambiense (strain MHOM/CI/86/DAL972) TaxID=679716 RepID=C9ZNV8_TRYB9|nr:hypothetical protein, unlikely [Trypanosoma brucei gambiense DAL972]CBH11086.1 hypothetical protein, unlikely [Trypanosoma brucei gambiense DAL972]|eukprot:XP_011773373.1 hypothetical protein, unlikely [Trypanosoma brucei gambiense DAL972]
MQLLFIHFFSVLHIYIYIYIYSVCVCMGYVLLNRILLFFVLKGGSGIRIMRWRVRVDGCKWCLEGEEKNSVSIICLYYLYLLSFLLRLVGCVGSRLLPTIP